MKAGIPTGLVSAAKGGRIIRRKESMIEKCCLLQRAESLRSTPFEKSFSSLSAGGSTDPARQKPGIKPRC